MPMSLLNSWKLVIWSSISFVVPTSSSMRYAFCIALRQDRKNDVSQSLSTSNNAKLASPCDTQRMGAATVVDQWRVRETRVSR